MTSNGVPFNQPPLPSDTMDGLPDPFPVPVPVPDPRFPNTRRRVSSAASATQAHPPDTHPSDPDTCRICRGEGTPDEPLFYPCKCSGSIKYVHQDCLMEWLSHSQKKHCELCKTPFRFTKLYDPNMPPSLPTHIFVSHTTKYLFRKLLLWIRAGLVVNVWLGWLPYLMRSVWSFLFWLSDEGLGGRPLLLGLDAELLATYGTNVCPSSPLFAATTTVSTIGGVINNLPPESARLVKGLYGINTTSSDPVYSTILRILFGTAEKTTVANATTTPLPEPPHHGSLLNGVGFLRNLTRHSAINRAIIAILEGQIITILVIVCFILIILVRDYVVQQQPEINMRAAFAAVENQQPGPFNPGQLEVEAGDIMEGAPHDGADEIADLSDETASETVDYQPDTPAESSTSSRPLMPSIVPPDLAQARPMQDFDRSTVHEYLGIYREAGGDPEKILEIARERQLEVRLDYWMRLTRSMMDRRREILNPDTQAGPSWAEHALDTGIDSASKRSESADAKGKGKLVEDQPEDKLIEDIQEAVRHPIANPLRPRANTDGPPISSAINPLANNSWSFADLPKETFSPWTPESPVAAGSMREASSSWSPQIPDTEEDGDLRWDTPESSESATRPPSSLGPEPQHLDVEPDALPDQPLPQDTPPRPPRPDPEGLVGRVADFMWREVDNIPDADLAPVNYLGDFGDDNLDEEPQGNALPNPPDRDREVAEAAAAAGLDAEAIEDAEDLEGILELLGMRGPVAGLFQNAIFCAFLVSITIFVGVFIPYNLGRLSIWGLANPMRIARILFSFSKFVQDCALLTLGLCGSTLAESIRVLCRAFMLKPIAEYSQGMVNASWTMAVGAANRIGGSFVTELPLISAAEMRNFSAISHEALLSLREHIALTFSGLWGLLAFLFGGDYTLRGAVAFVVSALATIWEIVKGLPTAIANPSSWVLNLSLPETTGTINPALAYWSGADRFWAILAGYLTMSLMAGLYLRRGTPFSSTQAARDWEASLIDGLKQASGVMKVILIISIEMLVFPLYCGMLLDLALLPLFEHATIKSRLLFTVNYPITSIFVHWFIGTGYMFHFALFVSMCRKIMRKGVLYFIRDPDDPEFHPVRDVLERSVATQLRKILFSAFVYGALVVVCLGGVVWGLYLSLSNVLPIHYSSNEPVLEFPIDLLFYNFLMPFAVRFFKPSNGLHAMYTWWFRRCARALRITWFLFGERRIDEEGHLVLKADSSDRQLPFWRQAFLEIDGRGHVVARTWRGIFEGGTAKRPTFKKEHMMLYNVRKSNLVQSGQLVPDGRFVRSPASDQVKIPKGVRVFLEVNENNTRRDDAPDRDTDLYSSKQYQLVYVPPHFRVRIFLFILYIWIFAAVTGVSITIVPLVFGRWMFKRLIPGHIRSNDVYAFSIGIHILGSAAYALFYVRSIYGAAKERLGAVADTVFRRDGVRRVIEAVALTARLMYTYFFVLVVFPLLAASLMELYALIPLHEVMYGATLDKHGGKPNQAANPVHTIRVIQAWTIGLLYLKLALRITNTWFRGSRMSNAARAVLRRGWLDPDASILTRSFIIPALAVWLAAVATPLLLARSTIAHGLADALVAASGTGPDGALPGPALRDAYLVLIYRLSFPLVALAIVSGLTLWSVVGVFRSWQVRIRDEAYLIGERLHNFGGTNAPRPRAAAAWRAGGARI